MHRTLAERCVSASSELGELACSKAAAQSACGAKTSCVRSVRGNSEITSKVEAHYAVNAVTEGKSSGTQRLGPARRVMNNEFSFMRYVWQRAGGVGRFWGIHPQRQCPRVRPNHSVKRSAIGRPPSPRGAVVYPAPHGLGVLPLSPAYLER